MAIDYRAIQKKAEGALLAADAKPVVLRRPGAATTNETPGTATTLTTTYGVPTDYPVYAVEGSPDRKLVDGKNILATDRRFLCSAVGLPETLDDLPKPGWKLIAEGVEHPIAWVSMIRPAFVPVTVTAYVRS